MLLLLCGAGCQRTTAIDQRDAAIDQRDAAVDTRAADICAAAGGGDTDTVRSLLAGGLSSNVEGPDGRGPLHFAASEGQVSVAELLLGHGAEANAKDDRGRTPLHLAAQRGQEGVAELLVDYGADVDAKDDGGHTPMNLAAGSAHADRLRALLSSAQPEAGEEPAAEVGHSQVWVVDVASGERQLVGDGNWPLWSPDGSLLAFLSDAPDDCVPGISGYAISVWDGESVRRIARICVSPPHFAWTADSGHLIVAGMRYLGEYTSDQELVQVSVADPGLRQHLGPGSILRSWPRDACPVGGLRVGPQGQRYVLPSPSSPPREPSS